MADPSGTDVALRDYEPQTDTFQDEVITGLHHRPKWLPSKFFYDARGSKLFDAITELDVYYPTRTEVEIMATHAEAMAERIGPRALIVEFGSGSSLKTQILLDHLIDPVACVPIDISREHLLNAARELQARYPDIEILPVCADYTGAYELPTPSTLAEQVVAYYPGSTIGNFEPEAAQAFLQQIARLVGPGGGLLIGVDLRKDEPVLHAAYNDPEGVTAAFNLNVLARINRELGGTFDLDAFRHDAFFNDAASRIEMHLVSQRDQTAMVGGEAFSFAEGETIRTEYSYKYTLDAFAALAARAGFRVTDVWTDDRDWFSVQFLQAQED